MDEISDLLKDKVFFFVSPDVKRGMFPAGLNYHIICTYSEPVIEVLRKNGSRIWCAEESGGDINKLNNTSRLLENPKVKDYIKANTKGLPNIIFFKPSLKIDLLTASLGYKKIGNDFSLNEIFENKIESYVILKKYLPENVITGTVLKLCEIDYSEVKKTLGLPVVLQFGHGWAGKNTYFVKNQYDLKKLKTQYPETKCRVMKYISGKSYLNNCCIYGENILVGPPALQISGYPEIFPNPAVTCGRQWPGRFLKETEKEEIYKISMALGSVLKKSGYRGFFGIDFLQEEDTGKIFVSEINARLTASSAFYSHLENSQGAISLFQYHLFSFTDIKYPLKISKNICGSQIILRKNGAEIKDKAGFYIKNYLKKETRENLYDPSGLNPEEYMYIENRTGKKDTTGTETGRIETKMEAIDKKGNLSEWLRNILKQTDYQKN